MSLNGKEVWNVPNEFRKIIYNEGLFSSSLLNFKYDVFDVNNDYTKEDLINSKNVTAAIFLLDQKIDALEFLQRIKAIALFFNSLSDVEMKAVKHWIKNTVPGQLSDSAIKILECNKGDVELMVASNAFILDEMKEEAKIEGKQEGIQLAILNNLNDIGEVSDDIKKIISSQTELITLMQWNKLSARASIIEDFIKEINLPKDN